MHPGIYETVLDWIPDGARVLDLGTGDGAFLERVVRLKRAVAEGVERNPELVAGCIQRGLVVHQGNIAEGLDQYGDQSFDYVLLLGTFQELISPTEIVREAFRVGGRVIIAYSNFAHYRVRLQILFRRTHTRHQIPSPALVSHGEPALPVPARLPRILPADVRSQVFVMPALTRAAGW